MSQVSEKYIKTFYEDMDELSILRPDLMPRATECLDNIRTLISELIANGSAYSIDGDVYFSVANHPSYGKLSKRDLNSQEKNADGRMSATAGSKKKHQFDFALWKKAKVEEPSFSSPWGSGRPGWHIECSAMVRKELGETIDIHLGGSDLIFPHHENEIAQSEAANQKELARFWLHNGMVNVEGQKMSKSLGNFTTIRSLLKRGISAMTLRLFILQAHYKKPLDFSESSLNAASRGWKNLNTALLLGYNHKEKLEWNLKSTDPQINKPENCKSNNSKDLFIESMDNDLNTSSALSILFELARPLRSISNRLERGERIEFKDNENELLQIKWQLLIELSGTLGFEAEVGSKIQEDQDLLKDIDIEAAIRSRSKAKSDRNYTKADKIRNELKDVGIELIDRPGGITEWIRR